MPLHIRTTQTFLLLISIVGIVGWARPARLIRGLVLSARERHYVIAARAFGASDFHMTVGRPPMLRVSGSMEPIRYRTLSEADFSELMKPIVPERLWEEFVYSNQGQILYLQGYAHPARFADLISKKSIPKSVSSAFPASWLAAKPKFASLAQINNGAALIKQQWPSKVGS